MPERKKRRTILAVIVAQSINFLTFPFFSSTFEPQLSVVSLAHMLNQANLEEIRKNPQEKISIKNTRERKFAVTAKTNCKWRTCLNFSWIVKEKSFTCNAHLIKSTWCNFCIKAPYFISLNTYNPAQMHSWTSYLHAQKDCAS